MARNPYSLGTDEVKTVSLYKALVAEFVGIFILCFFSCAAVTHANQGSGATAEGAEGAAAASSSSTTDLVLIALAFGFSVFMSISVSWQFFQQSNPLIFSSSQTLGHVSGSHINPAITIGLLVTGKVSLIRAFFYVIVQIVGAILGVLVLNELVKNVPGKGPINLGHTSLNPDVSPIQGFGFEFFLGFILVLVVYGVTDPNKPESRYLAPLAIGLTVALGHLGAVTYTGSSMNPARTLGTAVATGNWEDHWVRFNFELKKGEN